MDPKLAFFVVLACLTGGSAIAVVVAQNIVRSAAWLLFTLAGVAGIYFLIGADFVAGTQLIVYVGGILVLVVFGVMLTAQGPFITMKTGPADWAIGGTVGALLLGILVYSILTTSWTTKHSQQMSDAANSKSSAAMGQAFLGIDGVAPEGDVTGISGAQTFARQRVGYLLPFEIVSVHLLVVLIGAAYLARAKRRRGVVS
ncbi:MAG TPA: NADH-quinone oxidoreductase subunit J [Gemmataceae bacterium]|jgi:NADH:ubiquinone oxidoreductase subunit 6 (subunit J)|nr:NADH-quinone oxidoreductase subunit J [Gemmataceae bacterium]